MTKTIRPAISLCLLVLVSGSAARLYGQDADAGPAPPAGAEEVATTGNGTDEEVQDDLISMTVSDAKLQDVLQLLGAMRPGVNIIMGSDVEGTVPLLTIQDSTFEEALKLLAESCDLSVRKEGEKTYRVEKIVQLPPGALQIELLTPALARDLPVEEVRRLLSLRHALDGMTEAEMRHLLAENADEYIQRLSVTEASPVDVVNEIARKAELNFAFSPGAAGPATGEDGESLAQGGPNFPRLTLNLRLMSVVDALKMVSSQGGLSCNNQNGVWVVAPLPPQKLREAPLEMATFTLQFITIDDDVLAMCESLLSSRGSVSRGKNRVLVVRDVAESVGSIRTAIEVMDRPTPQVLIEARFFELSDSFSEYLGVEWTSLGQEGLSISTGPYSEELNTQRVERDVLQNPTRSSSSTTTDTVSTDVATGAITGSVTNTTTETSTAGTKTTDTVDETATRTARAAILNVGQLNAVLHALRSNEGATQLSNPKVIVSSDEQATIHIGDQTPILKSSTEGDSGVKSYELDGDFGGQTVEEVALADDEGERATMRTYTTPKGYLDLGTKLTVAPSVKTEDQVYIKVMPELVTLTGYETTGAGDRYPQLFSTRVNTQFTIKSGQTIAIGGLVNERDRNSESKVPVLGSIPVVGRAFRYNSMVRTKTETIIFLTVKIMPSQQMLTTAGIPIRAHMVQPQVDRIRMEDAQGAEYDEERARQTMREVIREAEERDWSPGKLRRKLDELLSREGAAERAQEEAGPSETSEPEETTAPDADAAVAEPTGDAEPRDDPGADASTNGGAENEDDDETNANPEPTTSTEVAQ